VQRSDGKTNNHGNNRESKQGWREHRMGRDSKETVATAKKRTQQPEHRGNRTTAATKTPTKTPRKQNDRGNQNGNQNNTGTKQPQEQNNRRNETKPQQNNHRNKISQEKTTAIEKQPRKSNKQPRHQPTTAPTDRSRKLHQPQEPTARANKQSPKCER